MPPAAKRAAAAGAAAVGVAVGVVSLAPAASAAADRAVAAAGAPSLPYDWVFHLLSWAAVGYTAARATRRRRWLTILVLVVAAVAAEAAQGAVPGRTVEAADLVANLAGIFAGVGVFERRRASRRHAAGSCRGVTVAGRGCRNAAGPGGWCGRCAGVVPAPTAAPTAALEAVVTDPLAPTPWLPPSPPGAAVRAAKDPATDPGALHRLAAGGWGTRMAVAANPSTAPETLIWLADADTDRNLRDRIAAHPGCPAWLRARIGLESATA